MRDDLLASDLTAKVPELKVPAYFLHGGYDYAVSYPMAKQYLLALKAPLKGFHTFDRSAHSPVDEQPDLTRRILRDDLLPGRTTLADRT
jgi:pimeloyl-ACP methyl ester carboxylesterase